MVWWIWFFCDEAHTVSASGLEDGITSPIIQSYFYPLWQKLFHRLTARRHFRSQMCGFVRVYKKPVPVYTVNLACKGCFSQIAHHFYFSRCEQHLLLFALSRNDAICCFFTLCKHNLPLFTRGNRIQVLNTSFKVVMTWIFLHKKTNMFVIYITFWPSV